MIKTDTFRELVEGKRCVVVAPSGYLLGRGTQSGAFIESFDLVVKSTDMCEMEDPFGELGSRCDIWYGMPKNSMWQMKTDFLHAQEVKHLRFQPPPPGSDELWQGYMDWFWKQSFCNAIESSLIDRHQYLKLCEQFSSIPFTGVLAVWDLLSHGAREVYAYGHDFYRTGYFIDLDSRAAVDNEWHKLRPQAEYFWQQLTARDNFHCDVNLQQILHCEFSANFNESQWIHSLLKAELSFFGQDGFGSVLLLRTCQLAAFQRISDAISELELQHSVTALVQSSAVEAFSYSSETKVIEYAYGNKISLQGLNHTAEIAGKFDSCFIPYNELELYHYLDILLFLKQMQCKNVYLISMRGIFKKIADLNKTCAEIQHYLSLKDEFKWLSDKYDRKRCI